MKPIKIKYLLALVATTITLLAVALVHLPHSPYIRYQSLNDTIFSNAKWMFERLTYDSTPIDVLFLGSSRTGAAASTTLIEKALLESGSNLRVSNISLPAAGMDIRLNQLKLAIETHPEIKLIVFGVSEALPRDGHQAFSEIATVDESIHAPILVNRNFPSNLARLPYRQLELWLATQAPQVFGYSITFNPDTYKGIDASTKEQEEGKKIIKDSQEHYLLLLDESDRRKREITPPILPPSLASIEFGVSRHYIEEAKMLTNERGIKLVFLFLPFFNGYKVPLDVDWLLHRGDLWTPEDISMDATLYTDAAHLNWNGAIRLSPWFSQKIINTLKE